MRVGLHVAFIQKFICLHRRYGFPLQRLCTNINESTYDLHSTETYTTAYTYDKNNRLTQESKTEGSTTTTTVYTYDANGNLIKKSNPDAAELYVYNGFNQLTILKQGAVTTAYAYNASGIRTAKRTADSGTYFLLDSGDVVAECTDGALTASYVRGINLICGTLDSTEYYYLHNAHGDVVALTSSTGALKKSYDYDAFGNEESPTSSDTNPFRYCSEYFDKETGTYYLRARYYDPAIGRFTQQDTHWSTANMIYGDNPRKINERQDALGLNTYAYAPEITAIMQSGNLYVYCVNNPVRYVDTNGQFISTLVGAITGTVGGTLTAFFQGKNVGNAMLAGALGGAISGLGLDIGLTVGVGTGGAGAILGIGITALFSGISGFTQSIIEQLLNGSDWNHLNWSSALISAGIGAGFSLVSFGLGMMVNDAFSLNAVGNSLMQKLINTFQIAGVPDSAIATFFSVVFVEMDKAMVETIINGGT